MTNPIEHVPLAAGPAYFDRIQRLLDKLRCHTDVVDNGRARVPGEGRVARLPPEALAEGDGGVTLDSARAWPGAQAEIVRIPVGRHRDVVRTPAAFTCHASTTTGQRKRLASQS